MRKRSHAAMFQWRPLFAGGPEHAFEAAPWRGTVSLGPMCGLHNGAAPASVFMDSEGRIICADCSAIVTR